MKINTLINNRLIGGLVCSLYLLLLSHVVVVAGQVGGLIGTDLGTTIITTTTTAYSGYTIHKDGRTEQQRQEMCDHSIETMKKWNDQDPNTLFKLRIYEATKTRGYLGNGCRRSDTMTLSRCNNSYLVKPEWSWTGNGMLERKLNGIRQTTMSHSDRKCLGGNDRVVPCTSTDLHAFSNQIFQYAMPAVCECGTDFPDKAEFKDCLDINECQEIHNCPVDSTCINTHRDYECECNEGL